MDHAFAWVVQNRGIDTEADYKYHAIEGTCNVAREDRHVVTIDSYADGLHPFCHILFAFWAPQHAIWSAVSIH